MPREMLPLKIKKYDRTTNFFDCFKKKKKINPINFHQNPYVPLY